MKGKTPSRHAPATDIHVSYDFEYVLTYLFGKNRCHGFAGFTKIPRWKKELMKLVRTIERAVRINLDTDDFHRRDILAGCESTIMALKAAETLDDINTAMMGFTVRTIFMLLGHFPNNWDRRSVSNSKVWRLDRFRKVAYIRTPEQRANLILSLTDRHGYSDRLPKWKDLLRVRHIEFKDDDEKFLEWFKENHRDVYDETV